MTNEYDAQKREKNNTVHLYTDDSPSALCAGPPLHQPTPNNSEEMYVVSTDELEDNEYLQRDGDIVGKVCGNCRKIALGTLFE